MSSLIPSSSLTAAELLRVNFVDALKQFFDVTGIDMMDDGGLVSGDSVLAVYFPEVDMQLRILWVLDGMMRLFPFPSLGLTPVGARRRRACSLYEMETTLHQAYMHLLHHAPHGRDENGESAEYSEATMQDAEERAQHLLLRSTLLRLMAELQALQLRTKVDEREMLCQCIEKSSDAPPVRTPRPQADELLLQVFGEMVQPLK